MYYRYILYYIHLRWFIYLSALVTINSLYGQGRDSRHLVLRYCFTTVVKHALRSSTDAPQGISCYQSLLADEGSDCCQVEVWYMVYKDNNQAILLRDAVHHLSTFFLGLALCVQDENHQLGLSRKSFSVKESI